MNKGIFITGTGTDIGKTYVSALFVKKLRELGVDAGYFKAAVSGNERDEKGVLIPGDAAYVKKVAGIKGDLNKMVPYVYEHAVSPHLASRIEGNPVKLSVVKEFYDKLCEQYEFVTVEGSGGILCPICFDEEKIFMEDVIKELKLDTILVADAGLGTINNVVLTIEYMKQKDINVRGIILNHYHPGDVMEEDNIAMIEYMTKTPVIACVKKGDTSLEITAENMRHILQQPADL